MGADPRRLLVVQTAFLGDVVLTTPLFRALRRLYPETRLAALVTPQAAPLVEEDPHLDEVLTYDKKGGESWAAAVRKVWAGRYDTVVAPHRSHRTSLFALASGAGKRVGFRDAGFSWAYTRRVPRPLARHEVDRNLELLQGLGEAPQPEDRVLHVGYTEQELSEVTRVLEDTKVAATARLAGLSPGSVWATKRWSAEGFAALGRALQGRGWRIVLLGGPDDREVAEKVARAIGPGVVNAAGRTSLKA
ncbi:MAG: glycosyltransferase family 9 protein, partial [Proteobacteria bacterium]|nr:glycosyltransferase family 9 protein [Pseudomonadota bacterium]